MRVRNSGLILPLWISKKMPVSLLFQYSRNPTRVHGSAGEEATSSGTVTKCNAQLISNDGIVKMRKCSRKRNVKWIGVWISGPSRDIHHHPTLPL